MPGHAGFGSAKRFFLQNEPNLNEVWEAFIISWQIRREPVQWISGKRLADLQVPNPVVAA